jgi:hypothetical protein
VRGVIVSILIWPQAALAAGAADPLAHDLAVPEQAGTSEEHSNDTAPQNPMAFAAGVALFSRGLWRGLTLGTPAVVETSVDVAYQSVTLGIVSSAFVGANVRPGGQMAGFDMNVAYDVVAGPLVVTPALNVFSYPGAGQTSEVSLNGSVDLGTVGASGPEEQGFGNLSLHGAQALDIMSNRGGWYADGGVAWSRELGLDLTLEVDVTIACYSGAFARFYLDESIRGARVGAAMLDSALTYPATDWLSVALQGAVSTLLDPELRAAMGSDAQLVAGGLSVGVSY